MSEFSDSYHLYTPSPGPVREVALHRGFATVIVASNERTVSFVVDTKHADAAVTAYPGVLARYQYGGDHGLWVAFFADGRPVGKLAVAWDPSAGAPTELSEGLLEALVSRAAISEADASTIRRVVGGYTAFGWESGVAAAKEVRACLGLAETEWLRSEDIEENLDELLERSPVAELIDPHGEWS